MMETVTDILSGLIIGGSHVVKFIKLKVIKSLTRVGLYEKYPHLTDNSGGLKVVGVGYGRTGTLSLSLALAELGYPTLHTYQLVAENFDILEMWTQNVVVPAIESKEILLGKPDFDLITSHGYTATADLPTSLYYEDIQNLYPDCKFILTTRDDSEIWFKSWNIMVTSVSRTTSHVFQHMFHHVEMVAMYFRWLSAIVNDDVKMLSTPLNEPLPIQIKDRAIASYEEHNRRVRAVIRPERLLEYNVRDGWAPLCEFLEITRDCPQKPFPNTNTSLVMQVQTMSSFLIPLTVALFVMFTIFAFGFKWFMGQRFLQWFERKWLRLNRKTKTWNRRKITQLKANYCKKSG